MADFNVDLAQPRNAGAEVVAPVSARVTEGGKVFGLDTLATVGETLFKGAAERAKAKKEQEKQAIISGFAEEQTALNDAMSQGSISKHEAAARARANVSKYVGMFPAFSSDFAGINKDLFEHTDLGEAKDETQLWKDQRKAILADMQKAGVVISPSMSPQTQNSLMEAFQESRRFDAQMERTIKRNAEARAQAGEGRAAVQFEDREVAARGLVTLGAAHLNTAQSFVTDLVNRAKAPGADPLAIKQELSQYFSNIEGSINAISAKNPELGNSWKQMFSDVRKMGEEGVDGKYAGDVLENQLKVIKNKSQLMALSDPTMQGLYATSALLHGQIPATFYDTNQAARDTLARIAGGKQAAPIIGDVGTEKASNDLVTKNVRDLKAGTHPQPEQAAKQLGNITTQLMKEMDGLSSDPTANYKKLSNVSDLLASPEWAFMVEKGIVSKEHNEKAKQAFQMIYTKDVSKGVVDKLKSEFSFTNAPAKPLTDIVDIKWSGSGVAFDKKPQYLNAFERQDQAQYVRELNSSSIALNKLIHIGAHMEGHTDYAKYWETNKHLMLPGLYVPKGTKSGSYEYVGPGFATEEASWKKTSNTEETKQQDYGMRNDGSSKKGQGYFGPLKVPGTNDVATEYSVGVNLGGKDMDIPTLVPTLTSEQKTRLLEAISKGKQPPEDIMKAAVEHARKRIKEGKSVFAD